MARGGRSQRRNQQRGDVLIFQRAGKNLRITKSISGTELERLKSRGHCFRAIRLGGVGPVVGFEPVKIVHSDDELVSRSTTASITEREMDLIAGQAFPRGKSKTAGLIDDLRDNRVDPINGRALFPEDDVERAVGKFAVYAETRMR